MGTRLHVRLLGRPEVAVDGQVLADLNLRKTQALLFYLAANCGPQKRSLLGGLLWGDLSDAAAAANLRKSLFQLRSRLDAFLVIERDSIALRNGFLVNVDVAGFVPAAGTSGGVDLDQLEAALGLYRGEFMQGFYVHQAPEFEQWVLAERARLSRLAAGAYMNLASRYTERGEPAQAIAHLHRLLALEPWHEEAHRDLMVALACDGQRSAALAQYETCRRVLREELDVAPSPETDQTYADIRDGKLRGEDRTTIPVGGRAHREHWRETLPVQVTPCIGRTREIEQLGALLKDPGVRLVNIIGPGGMGKTRLALAVAEQFLRGTTLPAALRDGIYFVPLAPLEGAAQLAPSTAAALALQSPAGGQGGPAERLLDYLHGKQMLLILDNFEHLASEGGPWLADIIRRAPGVTLLVTSREPLNLSGEQRFPIGGLPLPDANPFIQSTAPTVPERLSGEEGALTLFLDRARRAQPGFRIAEDNIHDVERICRMTGGMPLAIQLAASWIALLTPAEIAAEIAASFDFLSTFELDVPERHRSLPAVVQPSWARLKAIDQDVFARLCLCRGGFARADALLLTGCDLASLARLQQASFLQHFPDTGRFQIHEVLRQFGADQLARDPDREQDARERHARHYCAWLAAHSSELNACGQMAVLAASDVEIENCRAAWETAASHGNVQLLAPAADILLYYLEYRGRYEEGAVACTVALASGLQDAGIAGEQLHAHLLAWQGVFSRAMGRSAEARQQMEASLSGLQDLAARGVDLPAEEAFARLRLGELLTRGSPDVAQEHLEASCALHLSGGDTWGAARALEGAGITHMFRLEADLAEQHYRRALGLLGGAGDPLTQVRLRYRLALVLSFAGQRAEAQHYAHESVRLARALGDPILVARAQAEQAAVGDFVGNPEAALQRGEASLAFYRQLGDRSMLANTHLILGNIRLDDGDWVGCRDHADQALAILNGSQDHGYVLWGHGLLSAAWLAEGAYGLALEHGLAALHTAGQTLFRYRVSTSHCTVALAALHSGDPETARAHLAASLGCVETSLMEQEAVHALLCASLFLVHQGDVGAGMALYAAIRGYPQIANSTFCRRLAGDYLDSLLPQPAAVVMPTRREDLRALAAEVRCACFASSSVT